MVRFGIGIVLFVFSTLSLPPPGTSSREREFCGGWLRLNAPERVQVLRAAESEESTGGGVSWDPRCREGLRPGLRHTLDVECRDWKHLMDFEVRQVVDRVLAPCRLAS